MTSFLIELNFPLDHPLIFALEQQWNQLLWCSINQTCVKDSPACHVEAILRRVASVWSWSSLFLVFNCVYSFIFFFLGLFKKRNRLCFFCLAWSQGVFPGACINGCCGSEGVLCCVTFRSYSYFCAESIVSVTLLKRLWFFHTRCYWRTEF